MLLLVGEPMQDEEKQTLAYWRKTLTGKTPAQFAALLDRRVLTMGAITALVPRTMTMLNTRPGKPDPFADLRSEDRLFLLMAQWTPAQWAKAGSDTGIGAGDLTDEQRPLFAGLAPLPATLKRRVVVLPLPATDAELAETLAAVRRRGFTEVWLRIPFAPDAPERIALAVDAGRKAGLSVGAEVGWLKKREANPDAPDEIGIVGETGDDWRKRYEPDHRYPGREDYDRDVFYPRYTGWVRPQNSDALTMATQIAATPGLCAFALENPLPPGYAGIGRYGDGLWERVRLGYHPELRVACVRAEGFDPVDVGEQVLYADVGMDTHPFSENEYELTKSLAAFRLGYATRDLAAVW